MINEASNFSDALREQLAQATGEAPGTQPAVEPVVEAQEVAQTRPAKQSEAEDARLARVIQQAQQVRAERDAFKKEQEQLKADMAELARYRELKSRAKDDPVAIAEEYGYKPDEYATSLIEKGAFTPEKRKIFEQQRELDEIKAWRQEMMQERQQQQQYQTYNQTVSALKNYAEQAGENFDLVKRTDSYNLVIQKFHDHYQRTAALGTPEELPWEQAFEQAESELLTKYEPVLESPKIRSRYGAKLAPQSAPVPAQAARSSGSLNLKSRGSSPPRDLSESESLEAAGRLLLKGFGVGR